jgi:cellulose biosynthesis protein BcsQ
MEAPLRIISVQSLSGGTGVSLQAAEIALKARVTGQRVLAIDLSEQKALTRDLSHGWFHILGDCRHLFMRSAGACWHMYGDLPEAALLSYPFHRSLYQIADTSVDQGMRRALIAADLAHNLDRLRANLADLASHYDIAVVDVANKDQATMAALHDVADEVQIMARQKHGDADPLTDYLRYIGRKPSPQVTYSCHADRLDTPHHIDQRGRSSVLFRCFRRPENQGEQSLPRPGPNPRMHGKADANQTQELSP